MTLDFYCPIDLEYYTQKGFHLEGSWDWNQVCDHEQRLREADLRDIDSLLRGLEAPHKQETARDRIARKQSIYDLKEDRIAQEAAVKRVDSIWRKIVPALEKDILDACEAAASVGQFSKDDTVSCQWKTRYYTGNTWQESEEKELRRIFQFYCKGKHDLNVELVPSRKTRWIYEAVVKWA